MSEKTETDIQELKARIDRLNKELEKLAAEAELAEGEAKAGLQARMKDARARSRETQNKIEDLKDQGGSVLEDIKQNVETSWETWKNSFSRAKSEFKKGYKDSRDKGD
jgi:chromosome segregation ATPase